MNNPRMKMTLFQLAGKKHRETMGCIVDPLRYMLDTNSIVRVHPIWLQNLVTRTQLARDIGGFDPDFRFGDDDDFVFRLGSATGLCFVNLPMVLINRSMPSERHVGSSERWDDDDFRLRMAQARYEGAFELAMICRSRSKNSFVATWQPSTANGRTYSSKKASTERRARPPLRQPGFTSPRILRSSGHSRDLRPEQPGRWFQCERNTRTAGPQGSDSPHAKWIVRLSTRHGPAEVHRNLGGSSVRDETKRLGLLPPPARTAVEAAQLRP